MINTINQYITSKSLAWAPSTLRSEKHRLLGISQYLTGDPNHLWFHLEQTHKPYSRVTTWTRVVDFYQWGIDNGKFDTKSNIYKNFRETNGRLFKNNYFPQFPTITYAAAREQIQTMADSDARGLAEFLLGNGARFNESKRYREGEVVGKGNKTRTIFGPALSIESSQISYQKFRRHLKNIGLTPHQLRKLCATECVNQGMSDGDLCKVMGWESIATARSYLIPKKNEELKTIFTKMGK